MLQVDPNPRPDPKDAIAVTMYRQCDSLFGVSRISDLSNYHPSVCVNVVRL